MCHFFTLPIVLALFVGPAGPVLAQTESNSTPATPAQEASSDDWERLGRLPQTQSVKVHLRDGRVLAGSIQQQAEDALRFLDETKVTEIKVGEIAGTLRREAGDVRQVEGAGAGFLPGQALELRLRDGRQITGTVYRVSERQESLWLVQPDAVEQVGRESIVRVTKKSHWQSALLGFGAGAAFGLLMPKDSLGPGESKAAVTAGYLLKPALIFAGIGAAIGYTETIYRAGRD